MHLLWIARSSYFAVVQLQSQDALWSRLLIAALPSVLALGIAWIAFLWNRNNEYDRWVLDNKKAEWQTLISHAANVELLMPSVAIGKVQIDAVRGAELEAHLHDAIHTVLKCIFVPEKYAVSFYEDLVRIQLAVEKARLEIETYNANCQIADEQERPRPLQSAQKVQADLASFWRTVRRLAAEDLHVSQKRRLLKSLFHRKKEMKMSL